MGAQGRRRSAYFVFAEERRSEVLCGLRSCARPGTKVGVAEVAKRIGLLWRALTPEQRATYKEQAAAAVCGQTHVHETGEVVPAATDSGVGQQQNLKGATCLPEDAGASTEEAPIEEGQPQQPETQEQHGSTSGSAIALSTVKRVMLCDADVSRASAESVWLVAKATHLFLDHVAGQCLSGARQNKRRTVRVEDFSAAVRHDRRLVEAGLKDVVSTMHLLRPPKPMETAKADKHVQAAAEVHGMGRSTKCNIASYFS